MKKAVKTKGAPAAIGPYSQGIEAAGLVFTSGQLPLNPESGQMEADSIARATAWALENVRAILEEAGSGLDKVIKVTVFLKDMGDFTEMNRVYATYFSGDCPARSCFEVARLPMDAPIEIEAVALK